MKLKVSPDNKQFWRTFIENHPEYDAQWDQSIQTTSGPRVRKLIKNYIGNGYENHLWKIASLLESLHTQNYTSHVLSNADRWCNIQDFHELCFDYGLVDQKQLDSWLRLHIYDGQIVPDLVKNLLNKGAKITEGTLDKIIAAGHTDLIQDLIDRKQVSPEHLSVLAKTYIEKGDAGKDMLETVLEFLPDTLRHELISPYMALGSFDEEWNMVGDNTVMRVRPMPQGLMCYEIYDFYAEEIKYVTRHACKDKPSMSEVVRNFNDLARPKDVLDRAATALRDKGGNPAPHRYIKKKGKVTRPDAA